MNRNHLINCPDCGTNLGKPHNRDCDIERCSGCGQQRISCEGCKDHDPDTVLWDGQFGVDDGHDPWPKDIEKSMALKKSIRAKRKDCYYNSFRAVMELDEYANSTYVEGIAITEVGFTVEHGWIEVDGKVIDPTLPKEDVTYFPGLRLSKMQVLAALKIPKTIGRRDLPIFYRFGFGGHFSLAFRSAREKAEAEYRRRRAGIGA